MNKESEATPFNDDDSKSSVTAITGCTNSRNHTVSQQHNCCNENNPPEKIINSANGHNTTDVATNLNVDDCTNQHDHLTRFTKLRC
jgi:hypothetical protein